MKSDRRKFIQNLGVGAAGLGAVSMGSTLGSCEAQADKSTEETDEQFLFIGDDIAIADTAYGKVQGYVLRGIHTFLGIPYGADTSGENRFMPPKKPESWTEVKPAIWWGNSAPQIMENRYANAHASFADHWNYDDVSEDCLRLNIWTKSISDDKKRPVMVWLHGGGFTNGNGIEQDGYNGENLTRKGDIVFCSINHRLGPIGFTDLSGVGGEKYAASGNVGMLDIVAALEWVRDNIANFGGDPDNVTIMGQSGGGAKVCTVAAMPAAKGLFHKGVALSGSSLKGIDQDYSRKLGAYILKEAELNASQVDQLQQMPWQAYLDLAYKGYEKMKSELGDSGMRRGGFGPVADGGDIPEEDFFTQPNGLASDVPLLICTTFHERSAARTNPELEKISFEGVEDQLKERFGDDTQAIVKAYRDNFPDKKPVEIWSLITSNRQAAISTANAKAGQKAPVYLAWFGWQPPLYNNRMRAFHCLDICFWYYNTDLMYTHTGGGSRPRKLSEKMSDSLLSFMKTGDPNTQGLPQWPAYTRDNGETMILDDAPEVKNDPDRAARESLPV